MDKKIKLDVLIKQYEAMKFELSRCNDYWERMRMFREIDQFLTKEVKIDE